MAMEGWSPEVGMMRKAAAATCTSSGEKQGRVEFVFSSGLSSGKNTKQLRRGK
jgi:hypothetical protein